MSQVYDETGTKETPLELARGRHTDNVNELKDLIEIYQRRIEKLRTEAEFLDLEAGVKRETADVLEHFLKADAFDIS